MLRVIFRAPYKQALSMKRILVVLARAVAFIPAVALASPPSPEGCAAGGKMVMSFAMLRDQQKPIGEVDDFIDEMPGGDADQHAFYKKLARATYSQPDLDPQQARDSFVAFCSSPAP